MTFLCSTAARLPSTLLVVAVDGIVDDGVVEDGTQRNRHVLGGVAVDDDGRRVSCDGLDMHVPVWFTVHHCGR